MVRLLFAAIWLYKCRFTFGVFQSPGLLGRGFSSVPAQNRFGSPLAGANELEVAVLSRT